MFNDPDGSRARQYRIIATINRNIRGAADGSAVRIATLDLTLTRTTRLLRKAFDCGVHVRVIVPRRAWDGTRVVKLRKALGTDVTADSYVTRCAHSCLTRRGPGVMHIKSYLFSDTGGVRDVTVYSSSNLTAGQAEQTYNDAYQLVDNAEVHDAARRHFNKMRWDRPARYRRVVDAGGYRLFFFPADGSFHGRLLENTRCRGSLGPTRIRFTAGIWSRSRVAEKLVRLHRRGCDVAVTFHKDNATAGVMRVLLRGGVPARLQSEAEGDDTNHSKFLTIAGRHFGEDTKVVYSGALNVTPLSEHRSDNNMIRITDPATTRAYQQQFVRVWRSSRALTKADVQSAGTLDVTRAEARD